jgi:lysozyme
MKIDKDKKALSVPLTLQLVKHYEGCKLKAYPDTGGVWTIGWGNISVNNVPVKQGDIITQEGADELLLATVSNVYNQTIALLEQVKPVRELNVHEVAALSDLIYNSGVGNVRKSLLLKGICNDDRLFCEVQWLKTFTKDRLGNELKGLLRRRKSELELFLTGEIKF